MEGKEFRVVGTVTELRGKCSAGHKVGDSFQLSFHETSGLCGGFYHDIFHYVNVLQYDGAYPWWEDRDVIPVECPDRYNCLKMDLRRIHE